jgi:membrane-associated phospholipid phosphatase
VGDWVTIGHNATVHGCVVEDMCVIGMGARVLNNSRIGEGSIIAAGSVVPENTVVPPRTLWAGVPAKLRRELTDKDRALILEYAQNYLDYVGQFRQDNHAREAGILTAKSMLDGVVVEQGLKLALWQERPYQDNARGKFFQSSAGVDSAFPSSHTLIAFSAASALAAEYPSRWAQFALYSAATGVGITRVLGQEHFPADVLVGGALGWLVGHNVVKRHRHSTRELVTHHQR